MSGQGKYTTYVQPASVKQELLGRLFKGNSTIESPFAKFVETGDQEGAAAYVAAVGEQYLRADFQVGDAGHFPEGVNMDYTGNENGITVPVLPEVKWTRAGDPANPYMPDLSSPGPGETSPLSKDVDPEITIAQIKGNGYVPGQPGESTTRSPSDTNSPIRTANRLGQALPLGKNSDNEPSGF